MPSSVHRKRTLFYHYPKHCTMEDETLSVFGEFGEVDEVFFTMEFT